MTKTIPKTFEKIWGELGDIPVNNNDEIDLDFYHFPKGTNKEEIWHWVEAEYNVSIGKYMNESCPNCIQDKCTCKKKYYETSPEYYNK